MRGKGCSLALPPLAENRNSKGCTQGHTPETAWGAPGAHSVLSVPETEKMGSLGCCLLTNVVDQQLAIAEAARYARGLQRHSVGQYVRHWLVLKPLGNQQVVSGV